MIFALISHFIVQNFVVLHFVLGLSIWMEVTRDALTRFVRDADNPLIHICIALGSDSILIRCVCVSGGAGGVFSVPG